MNPWSLALGAMAASSLPWLAQAWGNAFTFPPLPGLTQEGLQALSGQKVALLVPARNEAQRLGPLLASVRAMPPGEGPQISLWVHDDASEDGTADLVREASLQDPRIRLQMGQGPPPGWGGKVHAMHRLAEVALAEGADWLLILDADVSLAPQGVAKAIAAAEADGLAVLSLYPRQLLGTWAERLFVPLMLHHFFLLAPQWMDALGWKVLVRPLNGQFLLWRADAYRQAGGFAAIPNAWLDDMAMGRHLAAFPLRVRYRPGRGVAACRMYENLGQVWAGFLKHHHASMGLPTWAYFLVEGLLFAAWVLPFLVLPLAWAWGGLATPQLLAWALAFLGLAWLSWLPSWWRSGQGFLAGLLHPLTMGAAQVNAVASWWVSRRGQESWKGRRRGPDLSLR